MNIVDGDIPFQKFEAWFADAAGGEPNDPNGMALATVDADGRPSVRMVLLKDWDRNGFVFYTNLGSRKGAELSANPHAALLFHWKSLRRQVRIEGAVTPVSDEEADAYFATRPKDAQIGAWASKQSEAMEGRLEFEKRIAVYAAKYALGTVPRPPNWSGYRVKAEYFEFWTDKKFRLHERIVYSPHEDGGWSEDILYP